MIIFSGWKTFAALLVAGLLVSGAGNVSARFAAVVTIACGVGLWFFGQWANRPFMGFNQRTGERQQMRSSNTLFFIPLQYWGAIIAVAGLVGMFST